MTNEEQRRYVEALIRELRVCEVHGKADRVESIQAELRRLGAAGAQPSKRAEKRAK